MGRITKEKMQTRVLGLDEKVERYYELDNSIKAMQKESKPLNLEIKSDMAAKGLNELLVGNIKAVITVAESSSMNTEKLLRKLESLGLTEQVVDLVPQVNQAKLEELLYQKVISPADLADCTEVSYSTKLAVKPIKGVVAEK